MPGKNPKKPDYPVRLTGGQLRVLHELTALVLNAPDVWSDFFPGRDWRSLQTASTRVTEAWRTALRAESTPAFPKDEA